MNAKTALLVIFAASTYGCAVQSGEAAPGCTLSDNGDGSSTFACPDGTRTVLRNGKDGEKGSRGESQAVAPVAEIAEGSFTVDNSTDIAALAGVKQITGDLTIRGEGLKGASFPSLERVDGTVHLVGPDLETIAFPKLEKMGGIHVEGTRLMTIEAFARVRGKVSKIEFRSNPRLGRLAGLEGVSETDAIAIDNEPLLVSLNGLSGIKGHVKNGVVVWNAAELTSVAGLSGITSVGSMNGIVISANPKLTTISLPALAAATNVGIQIGGVSSVSLPNLALVTHEVSIANNEHLRSVTLSKLASVGGAFHVDLNTELESLEVPELETAGSFHVYLDPALTTASFRSISTVEDQYLVIGTALRQCELHEWTAELRASQILIANNASGTCD